MKRIRWGQSYTRKFSIHKLDLYLLGMEAGLRRYFPRGMSNLLAIGRGSEVKWHFDDDQWNDLDRMVLAATRRDAIKGTNHVHRMIVQAGRGVRSIRHFGHIDFLLLSDRRMLQAYESFLKAIEGSIPIIFAPLVIEGALFREGKRWLQHYYGGEALDRAWDGVVVSRRPIPVVQLETDVLRLASHPGRTASLTRQCERLQQQYCWQNMRFVDSRPTTVADLVRRIRQISMVVALKRLAATRANQRAQKRAFTDALKPCSTVDRRFFTLLNDYSALRHERDTFRGAAYYFGHELYRELQRRFRLSPAALFTYTAHELRSLLTTGQYLSPAEVRRRQRQFVYELVHNQRSVLSDPHAIQRAQKRHHIVDQSKVVGDEVRGMPAYSGRVHLIVIQKLVETLRTMPKGAVMVTESTKPEYVPAMKKAAAIVTNEGGITSHAAIISREFKIPCVVGTISATEVFKDGDRVEVDAEKGTVRKI
ncbi:MAG: hypothetical protein HYZ09_00755 [Candidatus Kerfeldbacteria bacterium]|nr:hypothetical protein [Candidatus Kerfeldbacteria bacterium]